MTEPPASRTSPKKRRLLPRRPLALVALACLVPVTGASLHAPELKQAAGFVLDSDYPWLRPNVEWSVTDPASQGMSEPALDALRESLAARRTRAFLVVRGGRIVYEWYAPGFNRNKPHAVASLAKALVGSTALMLAMDGGRLHLDDRAADHIPAWRGDVGRSGITIRQLANHTSGLENVNFERGALGQLTGWKREYYEKTRARFEMALDRPRVVFPPGTAFAYSGTGYYALAWALTAGLQGTSTPDIRSLLDRRLMEPLGIPEKAWIISYGEQTRIEEMSLHAIGSGGGFTARAAARVGQLMLNRGRWGGRQIVDSATVEAILSGDRTPAHDASHDPEPQAAMGWWVNRDGFWPSLPADAYVGAGADHEILLVVPSRDLIMVRLGGSLTGTHWDHGFWGELETYLFRPLMATVTASNESRPASW